MGFTKLFRRSKKSKSDTSDFNFNYDRDARYASEKAGYNKRNSHFMAMPLDNGIFAPWLQLPVPILQRIFSFVCPHCYDESYETCEQSAIEDACMLCDLRDISHAGRVCRAWRKVAVPMIYHSIRIDAVHYCEREIYLSDMRKRKTKFDRNGNPEDPASARLNLLCRTLRDDPTRLGKMVQYFKTPYMLRESKTSDLARTIAVLPNLHYLDLPEGVFAGDPAYATLTLEVQARCPDLRKMTYLGGCERNLETLASGNVWTKLEVLELTRINMDPQTLRHCLSVMQCLRALKVTESRVMDDDFFRYNDVLPAVPALEELILKEVPRVAAAGLEAYLSRPDVQSRLKVLSLQDTGIHPTNLHEVLFNAPNLQALSLIAEVDTAFPFNANIPPLANFSLKTLRYEITASPEVGAYAGMTQGYYNYLAQSLFADGFPLLSSLYVRDETFADRLLGLPPPMPGYAGGAQRPSSSSSMGPFGMGGGSMSPQSTGGGNPFSPGLAAPGGNTNRFSSNNPFAQPQVQQRFGGPPMLNLNQTLAVYTKGEDENDWGLIKMDPYDNPGYAGGRGVGGGRAHHARSSSATHDRPLSSYGLADVGSRWREGSGGARMSVIMGNGAGGFLAVPGGADPSHTRRKSEGSGADEWPRPKSSSGARADKDLWR
ncbi:hypothetical protein PFICI_10954 [Pestalotiopsis fici W106-1]|uniref:Uncharacterized protein n=1 Tax=Pestalotiopsis fici (strain W106-1 / CGMCC3.15140) TaxID=1229662 RepID=W3WTA2_PESFW|nr:uncharacterized protein PFICI_10954 [Pestalotiopsis fici W106-1]ETS77080.1 hypothetical protein PFICI_10954 [Pestalotiopsis fici W106-1]